MPGMLTYGALAGVGGEYLKQSDERRAEERDIRKDERTAGYQEIRDRRLSELRRGEVGFEAGLTTQENIRQEGVAAEAAGAERAAESAEEKKKREHEAEQARLDREHEGPSTVTTPAGSATKVWNPETRQYEMVTDQPAKPTGGSSSTKLAEAGYTLRGTGKQETMEGLRKIWETENTYTDDLGNKMINPDGVGFFEWFNKHVIPEDQVDLTDPASVPRDPDFIYEAMKETIKDFDANRAIERIRRDFPDWKGPAEMQQQQPSPEPAPEPAPTPAPTSQSQPATAGLITPPGANPAPRSSGMLTAPDTDLFSGPIERKLRELERELAALGSAPGRSADAKRKALTQQIEQQRRMLGGG